jgi:hypothetical protein
VNHARRVKEIRARVRVQRWRYRQRDLASGAWDRFREALAMARVAYAIDEVQYAALVAEGLPTDDRGRSLMPERRIVWLSADRARALGAPRIDLHLNAAMLACTYLALVPFEAGRSLPSIT